MLVEEEAFLLLHTWKEDVNEDGFFALVCKREKEWIKDEQGRVFRLPNTQSIVRSILSSPPSSQGRVPGLLSLSKDFRAVAWRESVLVLAAVRYWYYITFGEDLTPGEDMRASEYMVWMQSESLV